MSGKYNQRLDEMDKSNWKFQKPEIFTTIFQLIGTVPATLLTDSSTLEKNPAVLRLPWNVVICIGPEDNSLYQYVSLAMSAEDFVDDKAILRSLYFMLKSADLFAKICQSEFSGKYDTFCNTQKRNITVLNL